MRISTLCSDRSALVPCYIRLPGRHSHRGLCCASSAGDGGEAGQSTGPFNQLSATIKRKQRQMQARLEELGTESLEERLQMATQMPSPTPYRLSALIQEAIPRNKTVLIFEVARSSTVQTPEAVGQLCADLVAAGADAIAVRTDAEDTPQGAADLFAACRASTAPVLQLDWHLHPLQIAEAKEAGAAGVIGVVAQVLGNGAPVMSSFAAAIGLDAPLEVVNKAEVEKLEKLQVPFYAVNCSVGLSLAIPSFRQDLAKGLLGNMPFGVITMVGVKTFKEAVQARLNGADALLCKQDLLEQLERDGTSVRLFVDELRYAVSGE